MSSDPKYAQLNQPLTDINTGLSGQEAARLQKSGLSNKSKASRTKGYAHILKTNLLTFFNILNAVLAALVFMTGYYSDLAFMLVIVNNLGIGLFQTIKAKRTLDKLSLLSNRDVTVIRDGAECQINGADIVRGDIIAVNAGDQLQADLYMRQGEVEVNESLLTGESDEIVKRAGDFLYSGSFVTSGSGLAQAAYVGDLSFANQISAEARAEKPPASRIRTDISRILKLVSVIVLPVGTLMFFRHIDLPGFTVNEAIVRTVASVVGMIPEGLFLITSITLAAAAIILAYKSVLMQDMYGIETLAYVDTLCLDKTGTLTQGVMRVEELVPLADGENAGYMLRALACASTADNATMRAVKEKFLPQADPSFLREVPFSSKRKYGGAVFSGKGTYLLGAFEFLFPNAGADADLKSAALRYEEYAKSGLRVLTLAASPVEMTGEALPQGLKPQAFIIVSDNIRDGVQDTLKYFYSQQVDIKIISGDNPATAANIAERAGVKNAGNYCDVSLMDDEELAGAAQSYTVFGRVSPAQKRLLIAALKRAGHTVAMTGDGVNDVLALREADCGIAVASGSPAARSAATAVLLKSDFTQMPSIVSRGRTAVNNVQRVAALFITKTIYAVLLALCAMTVLSAGYPFSPLQLTMLSLVTVGIPAFFLALEPDNTPIKRGFLQIVFARALPGGLAVAFSILIISAAAHLLKFKGGDVSTICLYLAFVGGMAVVWRASLPFTKLRAIVFAGSVGVFILCVTVFSAFFKTVPLTPDEWLVTAIVGAAIPFLIWGLEAALKRLLVSNSGLGNPNSK